MDVRRASDETGHAVGILADLQGPKIRTGRFTDGSVMLEQGARFTITNRDVEGTVDVVGTTYAGLPADVSAGNTILIDDGKAQPPRREAPTRPTSSARSSRAAS